MLWVGKLNSFAIIILGFILPLFVRGFHQQRRYVHVKQQKTWSEAQSHCRKHHIDLATFRGHGEFNRGSETCKDSALCWIGLHRKDNVWNWSNGENAGFLFWHPDYDQNENLDKNCVITVTGFYLSVNCNHRHAFLCYEENLMLVKENKTWEEALEHCRTLGTDTNSDNIYYDLPYMHIGHDSNWDARKMIQNAQTEEVWIGLRYLAGRWLWVNGEHHLSEQFPACPATGMYCGTMSKTGGLLSEVDCLQRRNFFCSATN